MQAAFSEPLSCRSRRRRCPRFPASVRVRPRWHQRAGLFLAQPSHLRCCRPRTKPHIPYRLGHDKIPSWLEVTTVTWRGSDGNDPSADIAKDADQRFQHAVLVMLTAQRCAGQNLTGPDAAEAHRVSAMLPLV